MRKYKQGNPPPTWQAASALSAASTVRGTVAAGRQQRAAHYHPAAVWTQQRRLQGADGVKEHGGETADEAWGGGAGELRVELRVWRENDTKYVIIQFNLLPQEFPQQGWWTSWKNLVVCWHSVSRLLRLLRAQQTERFFSAFHPAFLTVYFSQNQRPDAV